MPGIFSRPASLSWFTRSTAKYTPLIIELVVVAVTLRLLGLVQPFAFQAIIDRVLPFQREATLILVAAFLFAAVLLSACLDALAAYLGNHMSNRLIAELAARIFQHVFSLPLTYLQRWKIGETLTRIDEIDTIRVFLTGTLSGIALDMVFATIYIGALISISPSLTMIVLIMLPLQIAIFASFGPFIRRRMQTSFLASSLHQSRLIETLANALTVKALASERIHVARLSQTLNSSLLSGFRVTKLNITRNFSGEILSNFSIIFVIFFGSQKIFYNEISLGQLIAFHLLAERVSGPIMSLSTVWEQWQELRIARLRLGDLLNQAAESEPTKPILRISDPLYVKLKNLTFGYSRDKTIICNMSLDIDPSRPTLIVGDSGCGKSTLAKLICGLYQPNEGHVEVNGRRLVDCDPPSIRRTIGYLPQEPMLFSGSILENLLAAKPDATIEEIQQALAGSDSKKLLEQLENGIDTDVGERGSYLSGGQRQRIALARTLLTNPKALVLDEPTSALDPTSAHEIVKALKQLSREKTLVVITHNPALLGDEVNLVDLGHPEQYRQAAVDKRISA